MTTPATLAQDRRAFDKDGRMHVRCRISKATVNPYFGREIPDWQGLGLQPDRIYRMYRDPAALAEAADSFNNVPLLSEHVYVTAEDPAQELIVGTVSNAAYVHPYLEADVAAWTQDAIDDIESGDKKELSCAYHYTAVMIPGTSPDGVRYDGRMVGPMRANHVALVKVGRAGPDVVVADEAIRMNFKFPRFMAAISAVLGAAVQPEQLQAMDSALSAELSADAFPDLDDAEKKAACDAAMKALGKDSLTEEEEREAYQRAAKDKKVAKDANDKPAQDADPVRVAVDAALATAREGYVLAADADKTREEYGVKMAADAAASVHALYAARAAVADKCGDVALDSAEAVYRFALDHLKVPHADVPAEALGALYARIESLPAPIAADAVTVKPVDVRDIFPGLSLIRR